MRARANPAAQAFEDLADRYDTWYDKAGGGQLGLAAAPAVPLVTHLVEEGVNLPLLMAKSGRQNLRSLQRYAGPSADAVAAETAAHDPARRGR